MEGKQNEVLAEFDLGPAGPFFSSAEGGAGRTRTREGFADTGPGVVQGPRISQADADQRLQRRLAREFVTGVLKALTRPATQAQIDAMVDLAYNIGVSAFQRFYAGAFVQCRRPGRCF
ncbi:glycoside hydrolase family protein [Alcaligenes sp. YSL9]|uniref:glycoside hydrolase family protein n=1 Tax=Alcaligenes TaxID=507 RepID=UPI00349F94FC